MVTRGCNTIRTTKISNGKLLYRFENDEAQQEQSWSICDDVHVQDWSQTVEHLVEIDDPAPRSEESPKDFSKRKSECMFDML